MRRRNLLGTAAVGLAATAAGCGAIDALPFGDTRPRCEATVSIADRPAPEDGRSWPQPYRDAGNTGHTHAAGPAGAVEREWSADVPHPATGVTAADGALFVSGVGELRVLDPATGELDRRVEGPGAGYGPPAVTEDCLLCFQRFAGSYADLMAIGREDHRLRWERRLAPTHGSVAPVLAGDDVVVPEPDGALGLDVASGEPTWAYRLPAGRVSERPAVADGVAYLVVDDRALHAVDTGIGERVWRSTVEPGVVDADLLTVEGPPVVADGSVFVVGSPPSGVALLLERAREGDREAPDEGADEPAPAELQRLDAATGERVWSLPLGGESDVHALAHADGTLFVAHLAEGSDGDRQPTLYAVDARRGCIRWSRTVGDVLARDLLSYRADGCCASPVVAGDQVVLATRRRVAGFDAADGERRWTAPFDAADVLSPVAVADGSAYVASRGEGLCAFSG